MGGFHFVFVLYFQSVCGVVLLNGLAEGSWFIGVTHVLELYYLPTFGYLVAVASDLHDYDHHYYYEHYHYWNRHAQD